MFVFIASCGFISAQDIITTNSGVVINARVLNISEKTITYKTNDSLAVEVTQLKSELRSIHFANGTDMVFEVEIPVTSGVSSGLYLQGVKDANRYYKHYKDAGTGTLVASLFFPIFGLVPAVACSTTTPSVINLGIPNDSLGRNPEYYAGYSTQARKVKSKKVWTNYGVGAGIGICLRVCYSYAFILLLTSL